MAKIFRVKVIGKGDDEGEYDVQAKDDAAARVKAIKLWVAAFNRMLKDDHEQDDEREGERTPPKPAYTEKDVSYCETSLLTETDG